MKQGQVDILGGNELIVRGGLEAGFSLYTGYPGSPLADYFNILYQKKDELKQRGIKVVIANSEANAAAMASGAKQAGRDCMIAMKSMGLHVAADALSVGNFANPHRPKDGKYPGVVVVVGDDPWSISTSTPADSRFLFKHLHIPFLEPSTPQELKDWMAHALSLSQKSSVYCGVLLTTAMAEGGGRVDLFLEKEVDSDLVDLDPKDFDLSKNVMVPPNSLKADESMIRERFPQVIKGLEDLDLDRLWEGSSSTGIISSGTIFETVRQVLDESRLMGEISLYQVACSYPLLEKKLIPFLKQLKRIIVVEEKRGFLEDQLRSLVSSHGLTIEVWGKRFPQGDGFPAHGGLNYEIVQTKLCEVLEKKCPEISTTQIGLELPRRLPTFCPGCPHRETLSLLKDLRSDLEKEGAKLISHGDVGCYSLSFLPPFKEMHNLSAMGQGGALGAGVDLFTKNPSVILMGDSTFYHSGITDISNSVQMGHEITYILLNNDNTAMTGHQMTPASGLSVDGERRPVQNMLKAVEALGVHEAVEVNPSDRYFYKNLMGEFIRKPGTKVIISNKECALTYHGRLKVRDRKLFTQGKTQTIKSFYQINTQVCEDCRACLEATGCPGLTQGQDAYGTKVAIDPQICVADSYCTKIKACPSFELVEVHDYHPTKYKKFPSREETILQMPVVKKTLDDIAAGNDWRVVVTGVGGSGVTTISRVLAEAAKNMQGRKDLDFKFVDQKGLAQRNGNVTGHLTIYARGKSASAVTPRGTADLLLSPDLLDGTTHLSFLSPSGELVIDQDFQYPLSMLLDDGVEQEPLKQEALKDELVSKLGNRAKILSLKSQSTYYFGKSVYASAMILGAAFQAGRIPFTEKAMKEAFEVSMKKGEFENNWHAFELGRRLYMNPVELRASEKSSFRESLKASCGFWENKSKLLSTFDLGVTELKEFFPQVKTEHWEQYLHDILVYDRGRELDDYLKQVRNLKSLKLGDELLPLALRVLTKTYWIKDEVMVAHLMLSTVQTKKEDFYHQLGTSYQKMFINRPHFDLGSWHLEFDINPKIWMLKLMRHARFLRVLLPKWHARERAIALHIREKITAHIPTLPADQQRQELVKLDNIKGYREIRYQKAKEMNIHVPN